MSKLNVKNSKMRFKKKNLGMTYTELIVVLSIMSIMSVITIFNYQDFQAKVEIKKLANDVALKIVEAQKDASSGRIASTLPGSQKKDFIPEWKPAYGVFFEPSYNPKSFDFFTDLNNDGICNRMDFTNLACGDLGEGPNAANGIDYLWGIDINSKYRISNLVAICSDGSQISANDSSLSVTYTRSRPGAFIYTPNNTGSCVISSAKISLESSYNNSIKSSVEVYSSGMIKISN